MRIVPHSDALFCSASKSRRQDEQYDILSELFALVFVMRMAVVWTNLFAGMSACHREVNEWHLKRLLRQRLLSHH